MAVSAIQPISGLHLGTVQYLPCPAAIGTGCLRPPPETTKNTLGMGVARTGLDSLLHLRLGSQAFFFLCERRNLSNLCEPGVLSSARRGAPLPRCRLVIRLKSGSAQKALWAGPGSQRAVRTRPVSSILTTQAFRLIQSVYSPHCPGLHVHW